MAAGAAIFQDPQIWGDGLVLVPFSFVPNGSSDPVASTIKNTWAVASIVYTASNQWTVTLNANFRSIISYTWGISCDAGGTAQGYTIELDTTATDVTTGTVVLRSIGPTGTAGTIASTNSPRINVTLVCATSDLVK